MNRTGTWYPPSAGTGGMLTEAQLLINPPFTTQPMILPITLHQVRQQDGSVLWRICLGSMCRETPDWWQVRVWLEQFRRLAEGEPEGDAG